MFVKSWYRSRYMGKYMKKAKITGEVAVMEVSSSTLGVRTRAKTLALQRLQNTTTTNCGHSYLQLRSRRLKKPPLFVACKKESKKQQNSRKASPNPNSYLRTSSRFAVDSVNSGSVELISLSCSKNEEGLSSRKAMEVVGKEEGTQKTLSDLDIEASFGENVLEIEGRDRSTRETTPCNLIEGSNTIGSTTRRTISIVTNQRIYNVQENIPTTHEMEEFFASVEQQKQRIFMEKYNFDPVKDSPLPGRYEWVTVDP